jgi:hypothetical protein
MELTCMEPIEFLISFFETATASSNTVPFSDAPLSIDLSISSAVLYDLSMPDILRTFCGWSGACPESARTCLV